MLESNEGLAFVAAAVFIRPEKGDYVSIDQLPPAQALQSLRKARSEVTEVISSYGGRATFEVISGKMQSSDFGEDDTRLALASAGATIDNDGMFTLSTSF